MRERSLQIEPEDRQAGGQGERRLSARDAATHQSGQASMLSRDHSAVPTRRKTPDVRIVMQIPRLQFRIDRARQRETERETKRELRVYRMIN